MQELENTVLDSITFPILFYYRHVDDIVIAISSNITDLILNSFNAFHLRLQFTMELGGSQVNFLDITIILDGNKLKFDWFHKATFSGVFELLVPTSYFPKEGYLPRPS